MDPNETSKTVLVVDDEVHIVNVVVLKFRGAGFRVLTARDPQEAFEVAKKEIPDLVINDHQMPGGSGIDLCKWLKSTPSTESIPAILLTAYDFSIVAPGETPGKCERVGPQIACVVMSSELVQTFAKNGEMCHSSVQATRPPTIVVTGPPSSSQPAKGVFLLRE